MFSTITNQKIDRLLVGPPRQSDAISESQIIAGLALVLEPSLVTPRPQELRVTVRQQPEFVCRRVGLRDENEFRLTNPFRHILGARYVPGAFLCLVLLRHYR